LERERSFTVPRFCDLGHRMYLNILCEAARRHVVNVGEIEIKCFVVLQTPALLRDRGGL